MTAPHPALPLAALALLAVSVLLLSRRIGRGVYTFGNGDTAHDFQGRLFRLVALGLAGFYLLRLIWPEFDRILGPVPSLSSIPVAWAGLAAIVLGGALVLVGQWQMGRSWRIGLGREATALVTDGLFTRSRNPVFLGFLILLIGTFLSAANVVTATALGVGWAAMATQIRLEEAHLAAIHGADYQTYCARVARWL